MIATHGRGFWILDDVTPLRQIDDAVARADAFLLAPAEAVRVRPAGFTGTPLPKDEPIASNPPFGAAIDYVLKSTPKKPVTLRILDAEGKLVRSYSSSDQAPPASRRERVLSPEWVTPPPVLSAKPGMHRYVWPIRYAAAPGLARGSSFTDGVWAPPGRYTVELEVDGQRLSRALTVVPDPRVKLGPAAYLSQFDLARRVERAREGVAVATKEAEALHKQLSSRATTSPAALVLDARVREISELDESRPGAFPGPPRSLTSLRFLEEALDKLATVVDGADADPTPDARTGFAKLESSLGSTLAEWESLKSKDLTALNASLAKDGQAPVTFATPPGGPGGP